MSLNVGNIKVLSLLRACRRKERKKEVPRFEWNLVTPSV